MAPTLRVVASLRRSASPADSSAHSLQVDAERRGLHFHAERGNDQSVFHHRYQGYLHRGEPTYQLPGYLPSGKSQGSSVINFSLKLGFVAQAEISNRIEIANKINRINNGISMYER